MNNSTIVNETDDVTSSPNSPTRCEMPGWLWIRYIPVKLHLVVMWLFVGIGYLITSPFGEDAAQVGTIVGVVLGGAFGSYAQFLKIQARAIATGKFSDQVSAQICPHCNSSLSMRSFHLYIHHQVTKCERCGCKIA